MLIVSIFAKLLSTFIFTVSQRITLFLTIFYYFLELIVSIMDNSTKNGKVSFDPGWNDPPTISYNAQQTPTNRPRNFLNKRVAFPLSGTTASPVNVPPLNLPPMPSGTPLVPPVPVINTQQKSMPEELRISLDSESALKEVKTALIAFLESCTELEDKANDIKKRLDVMEQMWVDGKLNIDVQTQMKDLAVALRNDEPKKADDIHRALMVNQVSAVGTWMPGVKQLIRHSIARSELLAIDRE